MICSLFNQLAHDANQCTESFVLIIILVNLSQIWSYFSTVVEKSRSQTGCLYLFDALG